MTKDVKQLQPKQFVAMIRSIKQQITNLRLEKSKELKLIRQNFDNKIDLVQQKIRLIKQQYLVDNPFNLLVHVDRIEYGNVSIPYNKPISMNYETRKEQFSRTLKNGQVRYYTRNVKHFLIKGDGKTIDIAVDAKVADIKQAIKFINQTIEQYPESKNRLDAKLLEANQVLQKLKATKDKKILAIEKKYDGQIDKRQDQINRLKNAATKEQLKELNKPKRITLISITTIVALIILANVIPAIIHNIDASIEEGRDYALNIEEKYTFDCHLKWQEQSNNFKCDQQEISGDFSHYDTISLVNEWGSDSPSVNGDAFTQKLPVVTIPSYVYETENYDKKHIADTYGTSYIKLKLHNDFLNRDMLEKSIAVEWRFSDDDLKLIEDKNTEWKQHMAEVKAQEEAAKQAAEQKAAEEKAQKEAEEAAAAAAAEAARQAQILQQQQQQTQSAPSSSNSSSSRSYSPSSGVDYVVSGYCNDGTYVTGDPSARGAANACYGHKGWRDY